VRQQPDSSDQCVSGLGDDALDDFGHGGSITHRALRMLPDIDEQRASSKPSRYL
jgi:hypothetical protein